MLRLERMEICGFKSFSDRTDLTFPDGITGVVGPNGCGKSNIGDAINWVLGEQSPKMLRGRQMADVIFNGTEARKPLGLAEVTLVFAGADGLAGEDHGRVRISRRLYRSGESEYRLNGARARLMDIQELLRQAKVGARTYATIEQGRIDQVLNAKPKERRALIEDAAGVSGYKHKRRLAEIKLEATQANLLRVHDIVTEVRRQIHSLKRQAAKARRYRRLRDELRRRERTCFARRAWEADQDVTAQRTEAEAARAAEAQGAARLGALEAEVAATREAAERARGERQELSERQHQCEIELDRAEARRRACRERIDESQAEAARQHDDAGTLAAREGELTERVERQGLELAALRAEQERIQGEVEDGQRLFERLALEERRLRDEIEALRASQFEALSSAAESRNRRRNAEEAISRAQAQTERLAREHGEAAQLVARSRSEAERRRAEAEAFERDLARRHDTLREGEQRGRSARERQDAALQALARAREAEQSAAARLATLADVETRFTGVSDGVKTLLGAGTSRGFRTHGVVADYVQADREMERAAESYLEWLLPAVILEDDADARSAAELLRSSGAGRTAMISRRHPTGRLAVGAPGNGQSAWPAELLRDGRVLGRLRDRLTLHSAANGAVADRIGDAVVVDNLESALALHRLHPGLDYLTPDGEVVYASGVIAAGGKRSGDHGLLAHRRRLEEARADAAALSARAGEARREVELRQRELEEVDGALATERAAAESAERKRVELGLRAQSLAEEVEQAERRSAVLAAELASLRAEAGSLEECLRSALGSSDEAEQAHRSIEAALAARIAEHREQDAALRVQLERVAELRARSASARERLDAVEGEAAALADQRDELRTRRAQVEVGVASFRERARSSAELLAATDQEHAERQAERERLGEDADRCDAEIERRARLLLELDESARAARAGFEGLRELTRDREVAKARAESAREHLDALCRQELDQSAAEALAATESVAGVDLAATESEIARIKEAIERIGPVNMTAIEEFAHLEERHEFLAAQRADLEGSMGALEESIRRINRQSRQRFEEAFEAVRTYYQETYKLLFSGGRADLRLEEGEDILECGIEILAQPPGKRLAGVHLLSGGEKALSAVALLFAIFRYQPSPFCLLDEVDAALDDVNVGRFMRMVREYAKSTQFVIVTHNKLSMEAANLLYGVTMEERGVSKVVSLQLQ